MIRYIVIDNYSGYVIDDTGDPTSRVYRMDDPHDVCQRIAQSGRVGVIRVSFLGPHDKGYRVYRANDVARYFDRRNAHMIETIEQECPLVMSVRYA